MKKGDFVLLPFPFTDLCVSKNRPAIVLAQNELDVTFAFITSQTNWKETFDIQLEPNKQSGLKKTSLARLNKIATIDKEIVLGKLGELDITTLNQMNKNLKLMFDL